METHRFVRRVAVLAPPIAAGVFAVLASLGSGDARAAVDAMPECPHEWRIVLRDSLDHAAPIVITQVSLAGRKTNVPEFNDCQRFLPKTGTRYGPLVAIWASDRLDSLGSDTLRAAAHPAAAAEVYALDGAYPTLGIERDFNCLYLWQAERGRWNARMVPVHSREADCLLRFDPVTMLGTDLEVRPVQHPTLTRGDYPAVARWDWSPDSREQYISILCGDRWCEVGRTGFVSSAPYVLDTWKSALPNPTLGPFTPQQLRRVFEIRGWYDVQWLARPTGTARYRSRVWAAAFADPRLDSYDHADFSTGAWRQAAYLFVHRPPGTPPPEFGSYWSKFNVGVGWNMLFLCQGSSGECIRPLVGVTVRAPGVPTCRSLGAGEERWWGMVVSSTGEVMYKCVVRRPQPDMDVRGTVRWRWRANDESVWMRCLNGCCELE